MAPTTFWSKTLSPNEEFRYEAKLPTVVDSARIVEESVSTGVGKVLYKIMREDEEEADQGMEVDDEVGTLCELTKGETDSGYQTSLSFVIRPPVIVIFTNTGSAAVTLNASHYEDGDSSDESSDYDPEDSEELEDQMEDVDISTDSMAPEDVMAELELLKEENKAFKKAELQKMLAECD